ncbi:MAG: hypothetical protein NVS3B3_14250 [Aquirhabdus sp.]
MNHIRTICAIAMVVSSVAAMNVVNAASPSDTTKTEVSKKVKAKSTKSNNSAVAGQTDIVAKVDLPMVTNIMPWQEKEGSLPKNAMDFSKFSALKDYLMVPTDRDRIANEIRYISILSQPVDQK